MLRTQVKPRSKRSSLPGTNDRAESQTGGDADSLSQSTGREKLKVESKAGVRSGRLLAGPRANTAPDSKPIAMPASEPQVKAQSDGVLGLAPDVTAKTNSEITRELRPRPLSQQESSSSRRNEDDVASRLEELLGKQPTDLAGYLHDSPPQLDAVIYAFIVTVEALAAACASGGRVAGLVPQSICFDRLGKATIQSSQSSLTQSTIGSGIVGSPRYAAPEIFAEENGRDATGQAANVYALGFMFLEILLGRQLFRKTFAGQRNELDWLRWHADQKSKAPALKSLLPEHPAALSDLLESMTEKSPEKRITNLENILSRLRGIAQQASRTMVVRRPAELSQPTAVKTSVDRSRASRKRWAMVILVIVVLALAGLLIWQFPDLFRKLLSPFFHNQA
jgi:Protein kinase domain